MFRLLTGSLITDFKYDNISGHEKITFNKVMVEVMVKRILYFVGVAPPLSGMSLNSSLLCWKKMANFCRASCLVLKNEDKKLLGLILLLQRLLFILTGGLQGMRNTYTKYYNSIN